MPLAGLFSGLSISASGMRAERIRQDVISTNLANAETTRSDKGGPYRRQFVVVKAAADERSTSLLTANTADMSGDTTQPDHLATSSTGLPRDERFSGGGVAVTEIREDSRPPKLVYDPSHPDADAKGYVAMPNVNVVEEMTDMISATRAYEANVTAFNATKGMLAQGLQL